MQPAGVGQQFVSPTFSRTENLTATIDLLAEPHVTVLNMGSPEVSEAKDEKGESLALERTTSASYVANYYGTASTAMQVRQARFNLRPATKPAANLKVLRGTVVVELVVHRKPLITVDDILSQKAKIHKGDGDLTLAILQVQDHGNSRNGNIRIFMTGVERPAGTDPVNRTFGNPNFNPQLYQRRFEITDAQGEPFNVNVNLNMNNPNKEGTLEGTLYFSANSPNIGPAARLTYNSGKTLSISVPFEFRNVPMP
jgi:hypothetical protein